MRGLLAAVGAAALLGQALAQDSEPYTDSLTGLKFSSYHNEMGVTYRVAVPDKIAPDAPYDVVLQMVATKNIGWLGLAWGGSMTYNPIAIVWPNGGEVVLTSRMAFGYYVPPEYAGSKYTVIDKGTFVNATHYQVTAKCTGCTTWGDDDIGITHLPSDQDQYFAFAFSEVPVDDPNDPAGTFSIHDMTGHWIQNFGQGVNPDFAEKSKNSEGAGSGGGGSPGPSSTSIAATSASSSISLGTATLVSSSVSVPVSATSALATVTASTISKLPCRAASSSSAAAATAAASSQLQARQASAPAALPFPASCGGVAAARFPYTLAEGWKATKIAGGLRTPRGLAFDPLGNLLMVQSGVGVTVSTFGADGCINGTSTLIAIPGLNHGLALKPDGKSLYASSMTTAWRWDYDPAARKVGGQTVMVKGMNNGGHSTRALWLAPKNPDIMLIQVGSNSNWDYASGDPSVGRSDIRAFDLSKVPAGGYNYVGGGFQMGYGMRNAVGVAFDPNGDAWEVENSGDDFARTANGVRTDIHHENPAEELNYLGDPTKPNNKWYGYPTCFTIWDPTVFKDDHGLKTGEQFVVTPNTTFSDASCVERGAVPPRLSFQAHSAPISGQFDAAGDNMYVTFHGSWNRRPPTGFKLVQIPFKRNADGTFTPVASSDSKEGYRDIMASNNLAQCSGTTCLRPAGLAWDPARTRLVMGSDNSREGEIFILAPVAGF